MEFFFTKLLSSTTKIANELFNLDDKCQVIYCLANHPPVLCSDAYSSTKLVKFYVPNVEIYKRNPMWAHAMLCPCIEQVQPIYYTGYKQEYTSPYYRNNMPWDVELIGYYRYGTKIRDIVEEGRYDAIFKILGDDFTDTIVVPFSVTSIDDSFEVVNHSLNIYPNPVTDILCIRGAKAGSRITVFNGANEKMLEDIAGKYVTRIHVLSLPEGVYYVNCGGSISKIIKE